MNGMALQSRMKRQFSYDNSLPKAGSMNVIRVRTYTNFLIQIFKLYKSIIEALYTISS